MTRPSWDQFFMGLAEYVSGMSTCLRRRVGCVAVRDRRVLAMGFNGAPRGKEHCTDRGVCLREAMHVPSGERHEMCCAVHAEQNVIINAGRYGVSLEGAEVYCTCMPCVICLKMLLNAGVSGIVYRDGYPDTLSCQMVVESGLERFEQFSEQPQPSQDAKRLKWG